MRQQRRLLSTTCLEGDPLHLRAHLTVFRCQFDARLNNVLLAFIENCSRSRERSRSFCASGFETHPSEELVPCTHAGRKRYCWSVQGFFNTPWSHPLQRTCWPGCTRKQTYDMELILTWSCVHPGQLWDQTIWNALGVHVTLRHRHGRARIEQSNNTIDSR